MTSPELARMAASTRKASDVALGRLMAALEDGEASVLSAIASWECDHNSTVLTLAYGETIKAIFLAKQSYDAARLAEGGDPVVEHHNGMADMNHAEKPYG